MRAESHLSSARHLTATVTPERWGKCNIQNHFHIEEDIDVEYMYIIEMSLEKGL